jgi:hypothetical protein
MNAAHRLRVWGKKIVYLIIFFLFFPGSFVLTAAVCTLFGFEAN